MIQKSYKTAVVIIPPQKIWGPIQNIRAIHDRQFRRWMPHITLVYPFHPRPEFPNLLPSFQRKCSQIHPFSVLLNSFHYFKHRGDHYTIWLAPEPRKEIEALQWAVNKIVPECNDVCRHKTGFTPHLSVGQVSGKENLKLLLNKLQTGWQPLTFELREIYFISRDDPPNDIFKITHHIPLGIE